MRKFGDQIARLSAKLTTVASLALAMENCSDNPFVKVIDTPELTDAEAYSVEAFVYPGDTTRVYISRTSAESEVLDPRLQAAAFVELQLDGQPAVALEQVGSPTTTAPAGQRFPITYYRHFFTEAELPTGTEVRLRIGMPDGTVLTAVATVPRGPKGFEADTQLDPEISGLATTTLQIDDANGPDAYLLRGRLRGYVDLYDAEGRLVPGGVDSTDGPLNFLSDNGFVSRFYGPRYVISDRDFDGVGTSDVFSSVLPIYSGVNQFTYTLSTINYVGFDYLDTAQRAASQTDNILVEPSILPTNIEGGLGILAVASAGIERSDVLVR